METKVRQLKIVHKPPHLPCIWFQVPSGEALNDFLTVEGKTLDDYVLTLTKRRKKSLTANAYMWQLCEKIAVKIKVTKEDVYREAIRHVGTFIDIDVKKEDAEDMIRMWGDKGVGWFAEIHGESNRYIGVRFYQGSKDYDGEQMRRLIDHIVSEAQGLGIETMTPNEIERLKQLWGEKGT